MAKNFLVACAENALPNCNDSGELSLSDTKGWGEARGLWLVTLRSRHTILHQLLEFIHKQGTFIARPGIIRASATSSCPEGSAPLPSPVEGLPGGKQTTATARPKMMEAQFTAAALRYNRTCAFRVFLVTADTKLGSLPCMGSQVEFSNKSCSTLA